jgi:hypothetical protein
MFSVSVVVVVLLEWPVKYAFIGIFIPMFIGALIVLVLREVTPKGKIREAIELLFGLVLGVGGLMYWAFSSPNVNLESISPWWLMVAAWPSILFNLGIIFAWVSYLLARFFDFVKQTLEIFSGETIGR